MLNFRELTIEDRERIQKYIPSGNISSDISFTSLFLVAAGGKIYVCEDGDALYILEKWEDYPAFLHCPYPASENTDMLRCLQTAREYFQGDACMIKFAKGYQKEMIEKQCGDMFLFSYDSENSDYIYRTSDLISLSGKKYHGKRNHIKKFTESYDVRYIPYEPSMADTVLEIENAWLDGEPSYDEWCEYMSIKRLLDNFGRLDVRGCIVEADGQPAGFSFGEKISCDTVLIHFEKGLPDFDGIYQYINSEFLSREWSDTTFVNREEDMGIEGLRNAKMSYHPAFMAERFDILWK